MNRQANQKRKERVKKNWKDPGQKPRVNDVIALLFVGIENSSQSKQNYWQRMRYSSSPTVDRRQGTIRPSISLWTCHWWKENRSRKTNLFLLLPHHDRSLFLHLPRLVVSYPLLSSCPFKYNKELVVRGNSIACKTKRRTSILRHVWRKSERQTELKDCERANARLSNEGMD